MFKIVLSILFIAIIIDSFAQAKPILVFDLFEQSVDTIPAVLVDETVTNDLTPYFQGYANSQIAPLSTVVPTINIYPDSDFTQKRQTSLDYELNTFPIRTSVKLTAMVDGELVDLCSGSFVSRRHILTSAHCVSSLNTNELFVSSIFVDPIFDNGMEHLSFETSTVSRVYLFQDWSINGEDFALLELNEDVGLETGWIGIGFNDADEAFEDEIFYKFTYPTTTFFEIDPNEYNGDTLYYNYGLIDVFDTNRLGISNTSGIQGESGSSLIQITNQAAYTSFGVLSFSGNLTHSRINNWRFYSFQQLIENDLSTHLSETETADDLLLYPNPASSTLQVTSTHAIHSISIYSSAGILIQHSLCNTHSVSVDISGLPAGMYHLQITQGEDLIHKRIVKK